MGARFKIEDLPPHLQEIARAQLEGRPLVGTAPAKPPKLGRAVANAAADAALGVTRTVVEAPKQAQLLGKKAHMVILDEVAHWPEKKSPYRSKLEAEYHEHLKRGGYPYCEYEPMRLKLTEGSRDTRPSHYTPDFVTRDEDGRVTCWETKGFWREAARVRIKVAARLFPWMRFIAVTKKRKRDGGGWEFEEF